MNVIDLTFGRRRNSILARLVSASQKNFSTRSAMLVVWCRNNLQVCEKCTSNYLSISKSKRSVGPLKALYILPLINLFIPTKSIYLHGKHSRHTAITCMRMLFTHISTTFAPYCHTCMQSQYLNYMAYSNACNQTDGLTLHFPRICPYSKHDRIFCVINTLVCMIIMLLSCILYRI